MNEDIGLFDAAFFNYSAETAAVSPIHIAYRMIKREMANMDDTTIDLRSSIPATT
jgi:hypothetical protein